MVDGAKGTVANHRFEFLNTPEVSGYEQKDSNTFNKRNGHANSGGGSNGKKTVTVRHCRNLQRVH